MEDPKLKPKGNPREPTAFRQAVDIQRVLYEDIMNPDTKPAIRCQSARAWCDANTRQWVIAMRPSPKSVDVTTRRKKPRKPTNSSESAEPGQVNLEQPEAPEGEP